MKKILFSIFMCARNAECTIRKAINSVLEQTYANWELIIVDNGSTDGTWKIIENVMAFDSRVKGIRLEQGMGWAKGASLCLEKAEGRYMTFLAADDFLLGNGALDAVEKCVRAEQPDIVWIGHANVELGEGGYSIYGGVIPEYKVYDGKDKINEVYEIMNNLYYNSLFHFISIGHLKYNGIDFFEPYYADFEGVTEAMCRANKSVVLDQMLYALTINTSQTSGIVTWKYYTTQWNSIKRTIYEKGCYSHEKLKYISIRIMNNNVGILRGICKWRIRNKEMNLIHKTPIERLQYVEMALGMPEFGEMFYYSGREYYLDKLIEDIKGLIEDCIREGYFNDGTIQELKWLDKLVWALYEYNDEHLVERKIFSLQCVEDLKQALCNKNNIGMFGYELAGRKASNFPVDAQEIWNEINKTFIANILGRIYELLYTAEEIKKNGRIQEVIEIAKECMMILGQIKPYMSEEDLLHIANDLKMVVNI